MSYLHSSKRRPDPLKPEDYDHEIDLVDHTSSILASARSRSSENRPISPGVVSISSSRRHSDAPLHKKTSTLRRELTKRKYAKYQDRRENIASDDEQAEEPGPDGNASDLDGEERGRATHDSGSGHIHKEPESAIDVLYENQRGGFLCTIPLFSGRALGNLDPSPWTNIAQKTSATNISNAQVPDPSWEWAWKEWTINHSDEVDEDGWEYSFAFAKRFSWHGPSWWNSFVRRRAWIRKRVKKRAGYHVNEAHMLNEDYFTIQPALDRSRSRPSTGNGASLKNRYSISQLANREMEDDLVPEEITDINALMHALKLCRIDREKMEAVERFTKDGGDDLYYLRERMHDIMALFVFQESRQLLLAHILRIFNEASDEVKKDSEGEKEPDPTKKRRLQNLEEAVKHADEEVRRLEFWSDVKDMAENGDTKGAVDESQGWDKSWRGIDDSGPKDVISNRELPGIAESDMVDNNGAAILPGDEKGKGKAME